MPIVCIYVRAFVQECPHPPFSVYARMSKWQFFFSVITYSRYLDDCKARRGMLLEVVQSVGTTDRPGCLVNVSWAV